MNTQPILVPVVIGLVEVCKRLGIGERFAPVVALVFGIGFSCFTSSSVSVVERILDGVVLALSSVGLYSGVRAVIK